MDSTFGCLGTMGRFRLGIHGFFWVCSMIRFDALVRAARWGAIQPYLDPDGEGPIGMCSAVRLGSYAWPAERLAAVRRAGVL